MVFSRLNATPPNNPAPHELHRRIIRPLSSKTSSVPIAKISTTEASAILLSTSNALRKVPKDEPDLTDLNNSLIALGAIFPDVKPEVLREMLVTCSGESRLHIVADQLLKHKAKWVKGRWRIPLKKSGSKILKEVFEVEQSIDGPHDGRKQELIPSEEKFRTESYKRATTTALSREFKALSRSTIDAVLAEQNYSYTNSRPILSGLAAKTWRNSLNVFLTKWRKPSIDISSKHPMLQWSKTPRDDPLDIPTLRQTGDPELQAELHATILKPLLDQRTSALEALNLELATDLNTREATLAGALYECECCFSDTTFETMATCTTGTHSICFTCIRHAVSEALYGQSWGLNIDHTRSQLACLAPTTSLCSGCIPHALLQRAILSTPDTSGAKTWETLTTRLATSALLATSSLPLTTCPFCPYAEHTSLYLPPSTTHWRPNRTHPLLTLLLTLLLLNFLPLLILYTLLSHLLPLPRPTLLLTNALTSLTRKTHLPARFQCRSPACLRPSCLLCRKSWQDPHICHESAALSLRTTVEAAKTAALKRTCPRCGVGFVKDSGCNKMVCVCGYAMCYICRQGLGRKAVAGGGRVGMELVRGADGGDGEGGVQPEEGEGYRHFCQHFRPLGGRCRECERCDLYRGEDEDEIVRRAGERAEREWRVREGVGEEVVGFAGRGGVGVGRGRGSMRWGVQEGVDWVVEALVKC